MKSRLLHSINESVAAIEQLREPHAISFIEKSSEQIAKCFSSGYKIILAGNGGSLCDAAHFAEELTGYFREKRKALPAIVLNDPGHITCVGNDEGYESIFSRGIEAFGVPGDIFIGLTTSGNSPNIVKAFYAAQKKGLQTIAFLGKEGGKLKGIADLELIIKNFKTSDRIQEAHMAAIHIIIELIEYHLFPQTSSLKLNLEHA